MSDPAAGQSLGGYDLLQRLAIGGMAEIYRARCPKADRDVVVKVLLPQMRGDSELRTMFADEGKLALKLVHPNIVEVIEVGEAEPPFLVMEFVDGCTLSQLLAGHALDPGISLLIAKGLLDALGYLHGFRDRFGNLLEVVHRDLTPHNVLISRTGQVKLADLGIARSRLRSDRTRTGVIKGTVQYMSPEQVTGDVIDHRSDIYGAGMLLFEMLCGEPYIHAAREVELLHIAQDPPWRPPSGVNSAIGEKWDAVIRPALMAFPEQRYQDASSMSEALGRLASQIGLTVPDSSALADVVQQRLGPPSSAYGPTNANGKVEPRARAPHILPLALLTSVVAFGVAAYFFLWQGSGASPRAAVSADGTIPIRPTDLSLAASSMPVDLAAAATKQGSSPDASRRRRQSRQRRIARVSPRDLGLERPKRAVLHRDSSEPSIQPYQAARAAIRADMKRRGIQPQDLSSKLGAKLTAFVSAVDRGDIDKAKQQAQGLREGIAAIAIDGAFVRRKIERVDLRLRRLPKESDLSRVLRQRASDALQSFMDGRFGKANVQLNKILVALKQ